MVRAKGCSQTWHSGDACSNLSSRFPESGIPSAHIVARNQFAVSAATGELILYMTTSVEVMCSTFDSSQYTSAGSVVMANQPCVWSNKGTGPH